MGSPTLFHDRRRYSEMFGLGLGSDQQYGSMLDLMRSFGWNKLAIWSEVNPFFNEIERYLIPMIDEKKMTLKWMGKVNYKSTDEDEMRNSVEEMKSKDPRIILLNGDSPVSMACWLAKYGFYGPGRAIFQTTWSFYDPFTVEIPEYVREWCRPTMLAEVVASSFYFGEGPIKDVLGSGTQDSSGLSAEDFDQTLKSKVFDAESNHGYFFWPRMWYDDVLFVGYAINEAEKVLRSSMFTDEILHSFFYARLFFRKPDVI